MKKVLYLLLILSVVGLSLSAQTYKRNLNESAEDFIYRIKPKKSELVHPVIETTWNNNDKKVIIAFWDIDVSDDDDSYRSIYVDAKLFVPIDENRNYRMIAIDTIPENPMTPQILSVFFEDTDNDGKRELLLLYSWNYRHYQMAGTFYEAAVYDNIDYNNLPNRLTCLEEINGGTDGNNDSGEEFSPTFTNTAQTRAFLRKRGIPNMYQLNFNKNFTGTIGKNMDVVFHLEKRRSEVFGFYYYKKRGIDIQLWGTMEREDGFTEIYEIDYEKNKTAKITGKFTDNGFSGTWENMKTKKTYPISLMQTTDLVTPLPNNITGVYKIKSIDKGKCKIRLNIIKEKDNYRYEMTINEKPYKGSVKFMRKNENNENLLFLELEGFKWAENEDYNSSTPASKSTYGLDGYWDNGTITIQNYGNATNHYIKISDCDLKFIDLVKE